MSDSTDRTARPTLCHVVSDYMAAYPDPITLDAGDEVTVEDRESEWAGWTWCTLPGGEARWVPDSYLQRQGTKATVLCDYDATELTVHAGETVVATRPVAGWHWCTDARGDSGWVPDEHLACTP